MLIQILKEPSSYCLRERLSREPEFVKGLLLHIELPDFETGIKLLTIFQKTNPNYLI
jgi:hypothetical protein